MAHRDAAEVESIFHISLEEICAAFSFGSVLRFIFGIHRRTFLASGCCRFSLYRSIEIPQKRKMPRYRYKSRRSTWNAPSAAVKHMQERRELSAKVFGLDNEIIAKLFALEADRREAFFGVYERAHGSKSVGYARETWISWASKRTGISGQNAERFITLAPQVFTFEERYELVAKLYAKTRRSESHFLELVIGYSEGAIQQLESLLERLCAKPSEHTLPDSVIQFVAWIAENDAVISRRLMAAIETEQSLIIARAARVEISRLIAAVRSLDQSMTGSHSVEMPYGRVTLNVRKPNFFEKLKKFFG